MQPILLPCQAPFIINLRKTSVRVSCMQRTRKFRKLLLNGAWYELWHKDWLLYSVPLSFNLFHHSLFSGIIFQNIFPSKAWQKDIHRSLLWVPRFGLSPSLPTQWNTADGFGDEWIHTFGTMRNKSGRHAGQCGTMLSCSDTDYRLWSLGNRIVGS